MTDCYMCGKNTETPQVLVQEDDAHDDIKMYNNDYYPIYLCMSCWYPIKDRLDIAEKNHIAAVRDFVKNHPMMAYKMSQEWLDSLSNNKDGLVIRDVIPNNE